MTGILFIARLGSTRLSKKHLINVKGKTFIEWLILRFVTEFEAHLHMGTVKLIVATSDEKENRLFESVLANYPVHIFYGSNQNIPLRQLQCAEEYDLKEIISVDGDDILCSPFAGKAVWEKLNEGESIVKTSGLPIGMNAWGYQRDVLRAALEHYQSASGKLETGWGRIFEGYPTFDVRYNEAVENLRFTLDYPADADFFQAVIDRLESQTLYIKDAELIRFVQENRLNDLNKDMEEQYHNNFYSQKKAE